MYSCINNNLIEEFNKRMLEFLPYVVEAYEEIRNDDFEGSEIIIIEDVYMPALIDIIRDNDNVELLQQVFQYFEDVVNCNDEYLNNILTITVLEILGNDKMILEIAKHYMGPKTTMLQMEADRGLGRV